MDEGYEHTYEGIAHRLAGCDLAEAAVRLGLPPPENGVVTADFLGRAYKISARGVEAADGQPSGPVERSLLVYYVTSKGSGEPMGTYSLPHHFLPGPQVGGGIGIDWMADALVRAYGGGYEELAKPMEKLGAAYEGKTGSGIYAWVCRVLPKVPIRVAYYEADEEFPCEIKLMPDDGAGRFFEFETIAFLCGALVRALARAGGKPEVG